MRAGVIVYHGIIERLTTLWTLTYCFWHMGGKVNRLNDTSTQKPRYEYEHKYDYKYKYKHRQGIKVRKPGWLDRDAQNLRRPSLSLHWASSSLSAKQCLGLSWVVPALCQHCASMVCIRVSGRGQLKWAGRKDFGLDCKQDADTVLPRTIFCHLPDSTKTSQTIFLGS